jgi:hypothetical protein
MSALPQAIADCTLHEKIHMKRPLRKPPVKPLARKSCDASLGAKPIQGMEAAWKKSPLGWVFACEVWSSLFTYCGARYPRHLACFTAHKPES